MLSGEKLRILEDITRDKDREIKQLKSMASSRFHENRGWDRTKK